LYLDLFTTALEGGIGYWSECSQYHWSNESHDGRVVREDHKGFYAVITESEEDDGDHEHTINREVMARGYRHATSAEWRNKLAWSSAKPPLVVGPDTDWDYDASDADMIVQLGLFGTVVYG
jgi:hypothetical protein